MSTRGSLRIGRKRYYIRSDAYPSFARRVLKGALKRSKTKTGFIKTANKIAGFKWITGIAPKGFGYPFEEYKWKVSLKQKKIKCLR